MEESKREEEGERWREMERERAERELSQKEEELARMSRSLQAQEHHIRLSEEQVCTHTHLLYLQLFTVINSSYPTYTFCIDSCLQQKRLIYEKEQLSKELTLLQQLLTQHVVGVGEWRERVGRRRAERKLHDQEKLSSVRQVQHLYR